MVNPRVHFGVKLALSLFLTALVVWDFGTVELAGSQQKTNHSTPAPSVSLPDIVLTQFGAIPASSVPDDARESKLLSRAFAARTSELIGSWVIPLDSKGDNVVTNISLASEAVDFTILRPNELFSFNEIVGPRTAEKGYKPAAQYSNGEMVIGIGGGICILSTALYNVALETGLEIVERHPHSGPVKYAPPGRDAAVSFGWADLRFKNDTGNVLFIRSKVEDDRLVVAFYGTKIPGRTVEILSEDYEELPYKVIEHEDESVPEGEVIVKKEPRPGFAVTIVRLIRQNGKLIKREVISRDTILPKDKVVLVHPKKDTNTEQEFPNLNLPPVIIPLPDLPPKPDQTQPLPISPPDVGQPSAAQDPAS
ncbi:MAG: VanW family protein [Armatimonadota bacterium]|nr:VanW family protein [Armatimonadota bacterium]